MKNKKSQSQQDMRHFVKKITKDMTIGEILSIDIKKSAEISGLMFMNGLYCATCGATGFETLEQGCMSHGMSEKDIEKLVKEINKILSK